MKAGEKEIVAITIYVEASFWDYARWGIPVTIILAMITGMGVLLLVG